MTTALPDIEPQTAAGKVLWHFTMSLDGFVAGPDHAMDWMDRLHRPRRHRRGVHRDHRRGPRRPDGLDAFPDADRTYGGGWQGPVFVLTHHPEDAAPAEDVTFLNCDVAEAVRIALEAAGGKNLEVLSADRSAASSSSSA